METYRCTKCGYVYVPKTGDYTQDVAPNTPFENLPKTWVCPRCGALQKNFVRVE
ncbi:rubredoxin [Methanomicrobiaceae archaeon CYW5]|uniref:rubredoxin n=1 Tax=Methanovulcanius yangii TaxID=1789227 RepID=UPI0029CA5755|nr:rubredoxin [Methanovulcanius yangii]MBT8508049.1 rubredoxin [Methanovulcanius yangii]